MLYRKYFKRIFDFVLALIALIILSPLFLVVVVMVRVKLGRPVIFKQKRPGKDEKIFTLYKFRTMTDEKDENGELLPDNMRLSRFGKILRATSIDELPELINVIKGDMSLVGPRPLLVEYLDKYSDEQLRRHDVKPGITGMAQINGRNSLSWESKFNYDIWYVDNLSFLLDVKILLLTIVKVFGKNDIDQSKEITMEKFNGLN